MPVPLFAGSLVYISISFNLPFVLGLSKKIIICASTPLISFLITRLFYNKKSSICSIQRTLSFFSVHSLSTLSHIFIEGSSSHIKIVQFSTPQKFEYTQHENLYILVLHEIRFMNRPFCSRNIYDWRGQVKRGWELHQTIATVIIPITGRH